MNRREAVKATTLLVGGVWFTSTGLLAACAPDSRRAASSRVLSLDDQSLMEEIADTILPTTASSPGAKAAGVGPVINLLLTDCHTPDEQQRLVDGLKDFRQKCDDRCGGAFASLPQAKREEFVRAIDAEAKKGGAGDKHYFVLARGLALDSYFTSQVGLTKALRYMLTPGRWVGCMPLQPGQPAWG